VGDARRLRIIGWGVVALAVVGLVVFPLVELGRELAGTGWGAIGETLRGGAWSPIINTVWTSALATALTLVGATTIAILAMGMRRRARIVVLVAMVAPLLVPPFVSAISWGAAYGPGGLTDDLFGLEMPGLFGPVGIVALLVVSAMPIAYLIIAAALETRTERDLVRAARVSGADRRTALRTITLPLLRPALVAAGAVTFVMSANAFGVPAVLGTPARFATTTTRLYRDLVFSADPATFERVLVLAGFLALLTLLVVGAADTVGRVPLRFRVEASGPDAAERPDTGAGWVIGGYVAVTTLLPLLALVLVSLTRAVGLAPTPSNWTIGNYRTALAGDAAASFVTSLVLAVAAASIVVVLGGVLVALERRRRSGAGTAAALSFAVPGSVLAVSVLLAYGPWLRDTVAIILLAYVAKFWALGHRPIAGSADALSPERFGAARVSGATGFGALRTIVFPLLRPALVAAWLVVFMFGIHELTISSLLHGPSTATLAVTVLDLQQLGDQTVTAALAVVLTIGAAAAAAPLLWAWRRSNRIGGMA
jgi:iron(III) transport system permease protein